MAEGRGARKGRKKAKAGNQKRKTTRASANPTEESYNRLFNLFRNLSGASSEAEDVIGDVLTAVLGSVPAVAVGETMLSAAQAQGLMLGNAVANQQKTNIVAMVTTVGCVAQLLDMSPGKLWWDVEHEKEDELEEELEDLEDLND